MADCTVTALQYYHLSWSATALGASFLEYQIQRSIDGGTTWYDIKVVLAEATVTYDDYEAPVATAVQYRIRVIRTDLAASAWSTVTATALAAQTCEWLFTSNSEPTLNVGYNGGPEVEYEFLNASEDVFLRIYGRNYQLVESPTEERGVAFTLPVVIYASDTAPAAAAAGVKAYDRIRAIATADLPYVCVRDYLGNRFFAKVQCPAGQSAQPFNRAAVKGLRVTETTSVPTVL